MNLFFATDVHGSEICWKKFINAGKFYKADVIILGGDMTGKAIIPIVAQGGGKYKVTLLDQENLLTSQEEVDQDGHHDPKPGILPLPHRPGRGAADIGRPEPLGPALPDRRP